MGDEGLQCTGVGCLKEAETREKRCGEGENWDTSESDCEDIRNCSNVLVSCYPFKCMDCEYCADRVFLFCCLLPKVPMSHSHKVLAACLCKVWYRLRGWRGALAKEPGRNAWLARRIPPLWWCISAEKETQRRRGKGVGCQTGKGGGGLTLRCRGEPGCIARAGRKKKLAWSEEITSLAHFPPLQKPHRVNACMQQGGEIISMHKKVAEQRGENGVH